MGRGKKYQPEQVVNLLRQIEVAVANGKTTALACKDAGIVEQTYFRWRKEYGGLQVDHLVRWNKSFVDSSIVYALRPEHDILSAHEVLPNGKKTLGLLQVTRAPYQRPEGHPEFCDLLFLWAAN